MDITDRKRMQATLQKAKDEIHALLGILPICLYCKKIRNDQGFWKQIEVYIRDRSDTEFSHGICPECMKKLYPEFEQDDVNTPNNAGDKP